MTITLTGTNNYLLQRRLDELVGDFIKEHGDLAVERMDGAEVASNQVREAVQSLPFLVSRKLVVLREPSANKELIDSFEQIISSTADSTTLIVLEPSPDKRTAYYKALKSKTEFEEFNDLQGSNLVRWLTEAAAQHGYELKSVDASYLIDRVGTNQATLDSELQKLGLYDAQISRQTIDLLTEGSPQSKVFDLLDAAFAGRNERALELYREQRAQRVEPQNILAMIAWQLNVIVLAKLGKGKTAQQIASEAKLSPYPVQKAMTLAARLSIDQLKSMVAEAAKIDAASKTSSIDLDEALQTYLVTL